MAQLRDGLLFLAGLTIGCTGGLPAGEADAAAIPAVDASLPPPAWSDGGTPPSDAPGPADAEAPTLTWRVIDTRPVFIARDLLSISGTAWDDIWAVSVNTDILHFDGRSWRFDAERGSLATNAVFALSRTDVWVAAGVGRLFHLEGQTWKVIDTGSLVRGPVRAVWGSAGNAVWIGGEFGFASHDLYFWNGQRFDDQKRSSSGSLGNTVRVLWGTGANDIWAAGTSDISHWNGTMWEIAAIPDRPVDRPFAGLWGSGPNDVWAVGDRVVLRWNGNEWRAVPPQGRLAWGKLNAVWGSGPDDVWMAGAGGEMFHVEGQKITQVASGTSAELRGLWGSSANDVWAVGAGPTILHLAP